MAGDDGGGGSAVDVGGASVIFLAGAVVYGIRCAMLVLFVSSVAVNSSRNGGE
jgi:hypothetical protein